MYDTIIIGAGMSGLAAGIRLAYYEQRVCILERHYTIGGLNSFYRLRGRDYDVGLHAVTNYAPPGSRKGPLARLLRQLRMTWDDFSLAPQNESAIIFPGVALRFGNDPELLLAEIDKHFPRQKDNVRRLFAQFADYDELDQELYDRSARAIVSDTIDDPLLAEMILCPLMWYGNAREHDMHWGQFCILARSIFFEGLGRPPAGIRLILKNLVRRYRQWGGELRLRSGVSRIRVEDGRAAGVVLDDGTELVARNVLSSAGLAETLRLCDDGQASGGHPSGRLSFAETVSILDRPPRALGHEQTIVFFNDSRTFPWQRPDEFCDVRTGVVCTPNNFLYSEETDADGKLAEGVMRITALANFDRWTALPDEEYRLQKMRWYDRLVASAVRFVPDFRGRVVDTDMFTPRTIRRFTWHDNGAVYGAPEKRLDGTTHLKNLFICGTDQGLVGIIGGIMSGIAIANRHLLRAT
jgi:phytoene dehydrogenase-like protein